MLHNLAKLNKLNFEIPKDLQEIEYEDCVEFKIFLLAKFEEIKKIHSENSSLKTAKDNNETSKQQENFFETIKPKEETDNEKDGIQEKDNCNANNIAKVEEKNNKIAKRNNYLSWILGTGLTGVFGIGLFYMFSKKKF